MIDTSEIEFYLTDCGTLRKLIFEKKLAAVPNGITSPNGPNKGKHYLNVEYALVEKIEFYVHEFTEVTISALIEDFTSKVNNWLAHKVTLLI